MYLKHLLKKIHDMKLSDYVAQFLLEKKARYFFGVTGGASLHLIDSIATQAPGKYIPMHHEQSAAMAADGYARSSGGIGVAIGTSGPGATNLITGIAGAYYDSIPIFFLTGQVTRATQKKQSGVRQFGFQETPIVDICKSITKYSVQINDPSRIFEELERAYECAISGRMGPVLVDIPDDIQRAEVDPVINIPALNKSLIKNINKKNIGEECSILIERLKLSRRPILVLGWGVNLAGYREQVRELADTLGIPVVTTWGAADLLSNESEISIGTFVTHGTRAANFAIHSSDFLLCIGARMDTKAIGSPYHVFAPNAWKVVVDIDQDELDKFDLNG